MARRGSERLHDVTTSLETDIPVTETRVFALYRINTGYAGDACGDSSHEFAARFDVQVTQSLPFMNFSNAQWEALVGVRNLFRDVADDGVDLRRAARRRPPKRIVGGVTRPVLIDPATDVTMPSGASTPLFFWLRRFIRMVGVSLRS